MLLKKRIVGGWVGRKIQRKKSGWGERERKSETEKKRNCRLYNRV